MTILRKISIFIFTFFYFNLSIGLGISAHYCHGDLSSLSYIVDNTDCPCSDGISEMKCCTTVEQLIQLEEESILSHQSAPEVRLIGQEVNLSIVPLELITNSVQPDIPIEAVSSAVPFYITNSSLIFYA